MLITCPECELQVSDKALSCPHCGYPLNEKKRQKSSSRKHRRLPNGFGQISEIKGRNLRKPFRAMVTIGKTKEGRPISKPLKPESYFKTYNEAYQALLEFNKNPYDISSNCTFKDVYEAWLKDFKVSGIAENTLRHYYTAYNKCSNLYAMRFSNIRPKDLQFAMDTGLTDNAKRIVYDLLHKMYAYAIKKGIVNIDYSNQLTYPIRADNPKAHITFTSNEMSILWQHQGDFVVDCVLLGCYSGWRPDEMLTLKMDDVNLEEGWMKGGNKNESSKDRIVPIHSKVYPIVRNFYEISKRTGSEYLISQKGRRFVYRYYLEKFHAMCKNYGLSEKHRPHDCRVRFVTEGKYADMDEYALKRIVGHSISDITERVYSKRGVEWLKGEIEKIK